MKYKIFIFLTIFIFSVYSLPLVSTFAQIGSYDLVVSISVDPGDKGIKVVTKNKTDDPVYKITTTLRGVADYKVAKAGTFDKVDGEIVQNFTDNIIPKSPYSVTVAGTRISPNSKVGNITKVYIFETSATKPNISQSAYGSEPAVNTDIQNPTNQAVTNLNTATTDRNANLVDVPPSPGLTKEQVTKDKEVNGLVPCIDTCDFNDVMRLINILINFLITTLFIPIIIILFMYAGFKYITAEGNPTKVANLKKMIGNIVIGMLLVLCAWLIVKTIISIIANNETGATQFLK